MSDPIYCAAPWNHVHLRADGHFSVCCRAQHDALNIQGRSIEEYWNGEEMRSLRVAMIQNAPPEAICRNCIDNRSTVAPARLAYNELSRDSMQEIVAQTEPDGTTTFNPISLDIRTNFCNLKCRICNPGSSSSILTEHTKAGFPLPVLGPNAQKDADLHFSDELLRGLKKISWAGGEPFMSPLHWTVMNSLVRLGNTSLEVWYNSNFTFPGGSLAKAKKLLSAFSQIRMGASIDATGEDFDYLRYQANYEEVISNLLELKAALPLTQILIDYTATSLGLLSLKNIVQTCLQHGIGLQCKLVNASDWNWLDIGCLKPEVFESALQAAEEAGRASELESEINQFTAFARTKYQQKAPNMARCRMLERVRGEAGYFESRIGSYLNAA